MDFYGKYIENNKIIFETMLQFQGKTIQERFLASLKTLEPKFLNRNIINKTGHHRSAVSDYVRGNRVPTEDFLRKYCKAFGFDFKHMWGNGLQNPKESNIVNDAGEEYLTENKATDNTVALLKIVESQQNTIAAQQQTINTLVNSLAPVVAGVKAG